MSTSELQWFGLFGNQGGSGRDLIDSVLDIRRRDDGSIAWAPIIGGLAITLASRWLRQYLNQGTSGGRRGRRQR
jgi:hypothetical protein